MVHPLTCWPASSTAAILAVAVLACVTGLIAGVAIGRRRVAAELGRVGRSMSESYRQLLMAEQVAGIGHWRISLPDRMLRWSEGTFLIHGLDPGAPQPTLEAAWDMFHPQDRDRLRAGVDRAIADRSECALELRLDCADGKCRDVLIRLVPDFGAAGSAPEALFGVLLDITEQRRAEETRTKLLELAARARRDVEERNIKLQTLTRHLAVARDRAEQASRAKSRFLADISHELRTPLNGIIGYAQLMSFEGGLSDEQSERIDAMLTAGRQLLVMISRVLDHAGSDDGRIELQSGPVNLLALARECLDLVRSTAEAKAVSLRLVEQPLAPQEVTADPARLRQVVLGLLGGAVAHAAETVEVRLGPAACGTGLRIEVVSDAPAALERRSIDVWAKLASLLGGTIVEEGYAAGAYVSAIDLPMAATTHGSRLVGQPAPLPAATVSPSLPAKRRVLVVDDVAMNRDIAGSFLRAAGHDVAEAEGGLDAVAQAGRDDFDVILMDIRMPDIDGLEATRRIRKLGEPKGSVPIVALTAHAFAEQVAACREAGMNGHLAKPFTPDALLATVGTGEGWRGAAAQAA